MTEAVASTRRIRAATAAGEAFASQDQQSCHSFSGAEFGRQ
jgi:hypothetical protein